MTEVRVVDDPAELAELFGRDPAVHVYALADLEEPYWSASTWYRSGDAAVGRVVLEGGSEVVYAVSAADPAGSLGLVDAITDDIPSGTLVTGPVGLAEALTLRRSLVWSGLHHRFVLEDERRLPAVSDEIEALGPAHQSEISALYATGSGSVFFLPEMLSQDSFVGVRDGADLAAVAGTHVLSERFGVAAIGGVYTRPDWRGRGLAALATAGTVARVRQRVGTVGLNASATNTTAMNLYRRIGFRPILAYEEAQLE